MKTRNLFFVPILVIFLHTSQSQILLDTVRTIYSTPSHLHGVTFMKQVIGYMSSINGYLAVSEDSGSSSTIKIARIDNQGAVIQPFTTILARPYPIGKMQFIGIGRYTDSLQHQYLFWEEQDTSGWHIMFSHRGQTSGWETPSPFSPSSFAQRELVCTQTDISSYTPLYSFAIGWNENDSLTIVNLTPDSVLYRLRIATFAKGDSIHPTLIDGMVAWETHDSLSMLRYATFDANGSITSADTISHSLNASHPVLLLLPWHYSGGQTLYWTDTVNGIGNIVGSYYPPNWSTTFFAITRDSTGMNTPIFSVMSPLITKSARFSYFNFNYLAFIRTVQDSNAFVRINWQSQLEFWTKNPILDIDVQGDVYVSSVWIEQTASGFDLRYHIGHAISDAVEPDPSIPVAFSLAQNFPNPFNPSTTINYTLDRSGLVTLKVFNILGQEVRTLVNGFQSAGSYRATFNAQGLSSGVYFYSLHSQNSIQTMKMILLQ